MPVDSFSVNPFVGFGCAGYRSFFGTEPARMGPFDKVQVISGQNNCGKSASHQGDKRARRNSARR